MLYSVKKFAFSQLKVCLFELIIIHMDHEEGEMCPEGDIINWTRVVDRAAAGHCHPYHQASTDHYFWKWEIKTKRVSTGYHLSASPHETQVTGPYSFQHSCTHGQHLFSLISANKIAILGSSYIGLSPAYLREEQIKQKMRRCWEKSFTGCDRCWPAPNREVFSPQPTANGRHGRLKSDLKMLSSKKFKEGNNKNSIN